MTSNLNNTTAVSVDALAVGRSSTNPFITVFSTRNPTSTDVNYTLQQRWYNTNLQSEWILTGFNVVNEVKTADWQPISAALASSETLTGNSGGAVGVDISNNINVVGDGTTISVAGNPGTHTLTISAIGGTGLVETLTGNSGGAVSPTAGNINTVGTGSVTVVGNPGTSTLTAQLTGLTNHSLQVGAGTATLTQLGVAANGQLPIGSAGANPVLANITSAGATVSITNGPGSISLDVNGAKVGETITGDNAVALSPTAGNWNIFGGTGITTSGAGSTLIITATGASLTWTVIAANQTLAVDHGYICGGGGTLSLALPATSAVGDIIEITLDGSTGWIVTQGAGQQIRLGSSTTTLGAGGNLASTAEGDTLRMVCRTANTLWQVLSTMGNITTV